MKKIVVPLSDVTKKNNEGCDKEGPGVTDQ